LRDNVYVAPQERLKDRIAWALQSAPQDPISLAPPGWIQSRTKPQTQETITMPQQTAREMNQQMDRMGMPLQRFGALMLNGADRLTSFQLSAMQTYTHFVMGQWRDAMEIRDQQSMREFLDKQQVAFRDFSKKITEEVEELSRIGQDFSSEAQQVVEQNVRSVTDMTEGLQRAAQQDVKQGAQEAQQSAERASSGRRQG
jgi:phasin family protein